jgi:ankyrin repeat protein
MLDEARVLAFLRASAVGDTATVGRELAALPALATAGLRRGASRQDPRTYYLDAIAHHLYAGDTALHAAAAGHQLEALRLLLEAGADVRAKNRRGAEPLHYAVDGVPGSTTWDPAAQAAVVVRLLKAGAEVDVPDKSGVTPLHRAVRTRCAAAVGALLEGGADVHRANRSGSTPMLLATLSTGRGGSGSGEARAQQDEIIGLLAARGATAEHRARGDSA